MNSPLAKKLYIKTGQTWLILNAPENYLTTLEPLPKGVNIIYTVEGELDGAQLFVRNSHELAEALASVTDSLKLDALLWIIYPKKNSGMETDLEMMGSWDAPKIYGLRPVASAAVNDKWTALRFRHERLVKQSESRNEAIKTNNYSDYIDAETKTVKIPHDAAELLQQHPESLQLFDKLSYTNKKEYVVWILSAKQEQTRIDRIAKTLEKLLAGKKNPSENSIEF